MNKFLYFYLGSAWSTSSASASRYKGARHTSTHYLVSQSVCNFFGLYVLCARIKIIVLKVCYCNMQIIWAMLPATDDVKTSFHLHQSCVCLDSHAPCACLLAWCCRCWRHRSYANPVDITYLVEGYAVAGADLQGPREHRLLPGKQPAGRTTEGH